MKATTLRARVALQEIKAMGLTLDDLIAAAEGGSRRTPETTVADYVEVVAESYQPRSRRTYNSSVVAALRAVFTRTHKAGLVPTNPALLVDNPRRLANRLRRAGRRDRTTTYSTPRWRCPRGTRRDRQRRGCFRGLSHTRRRG